MSAARFLRLFVTPFNVIAAIILAAVLFGRSVLEAPSSPQIDPALLKDDSPAAARIPAKLYFTAADASGFAIETRTVDVQYDSPGARASAALAAWLEGPQGSNAVLPAPRDSGAPTVVVGAGGAVVDLPRAWSSLRVGPEGEWRVACGIAMTLISNAPVRQVQFLVGGEPRDTLAGHVALREPYGAATCGGESAGR